MHEPETKEVKLAEEVLALLNSYSFSCSLFAKTVVNAHPTLQQAFYRLLTVCIEALADENRPIDSRNWDSHENAKEIVRLMNERGTNIRFI